MRPSWIGNPAPESTREGADLVLSGMADAVRDVISTLRDELECEMRLLTGNAGAYALERVLAAMTRVGKAYHWDAINTRRVGLRLARCRMLDHAVDLMADRHTLRLELIDDSTGRRLITAVAIECPADMVKQIREAK